MNSIPKSPKEIEIELAGRGFSPDAAMVADVARAMPLLRDIQKRLRGDLGYANALRDAGLDG